MLLGLGPVEAVQMSANFTDDAALPPGVVRGIVDGLAFWTAVREG